MSRDFAESIYRIIYLIILDKSTGNFSWIGVE